LKTLAAKIKTKIISPDFDFNRSAKLRACMEISNTDMITALFNAADEIVYLQHYTFKSNEKIREIVEHLIGTEAFFSQTYLNVYISIVNPLYTLIPSALYQTESKDRWLKFNHPLPDNVLVLSDDLYGSDSTCVYAVPKELKLLIDQTFPNNNIKHKITGMAESLAAIASKKYRSCLVHVGSDSFDVALYHKKMVFFNTFEYQSAEDFLYFILASLEQNNFLPEETEIVLAGEIESNSALYDTLKEYFPKLKFAVNNKSIVLKNDFEKIPNHFYYSLFNLYLCAL
jgi:hypothetical protein